MSIPRFRQLRQFVPSRAETLRLVAKLVWEGVTLPATIAALFANPRIHPAYGMTWGRRILLALRMYRNGFRVLTATSFKAHLAMAAKLLEIPPSVEGVVVECGCFMGGSTANLSLVCDVVGRDLIVYDSFEGMPEAEPNDRRGVPGAEGFLRGDLDRVRRNVERCGVISRCTFRKGWFADTLPHHTEPIVACFFDVDYEASLHDCVLNLWPHLDEQGYVFIDEFVLLDYCALFWSERYWRTFFDATPPGLIGAGSGVPIGNYYLGPYMSAPPLQIASSIAYTRKDFSGHWDFYRERDAGTSTEQPAPLAG